MFLFPVPFVSLRQIGCEIFHPTIAILLYFFLCTPHEMSGFTVDSTSGKGGGKCFRIKSPFGVMAGLSQMPFALG